MFIRVLSAQVGKTCGVDNICTLHSLPQYSLGNPISRLLIIMMYFFQIF